jgi:oligoendopeptidase F
VAIKLYVEFFETKDSTKIIDFLKTGGNDTPINIFKKYGIDLTHDSVYDQIINFTNDLLISLEEKITKIQN